MFPRKDEWLTWDRIKKAEFLSYVSTFVASIIAALSFLGASIFSFLSWNEAWLTREDQRKFFILEKSPILTISAANIASVRYGSGRIMNVTLKNIGQSSARDINIHIFADSLSPPVSFDANTEMITEQRNIEKGNETTVEFVLKVYYINISNDYVGDLEVISSNNLIPSDDAKRIAMGIITYKGNFLDEYQESFHLICCRPHNVLKPKQ